jgi:hypothetical protein
VIKLNIIEGIVTMMSWHGIQSSHVFLHLLFPGLSSDGVVQDACLDVSLAVMIAESLFHLTLFGMPFRSIGICAVGCKDPPCHTNTSWVPRLCSSCHQSKKQVCLHSWHHPLQKWGQVSLSSGKQHCPSKQKLWSLPFSEWQEYLKGQHPLSCGNCN